MKLSDLKILKEHYDPRIDGYLAFGKRLDDKTIKKYVVGWYSRHKDSKLISYKSFMDAASARLYFKALIDEKVAPNHDVFTDDYQDQEVYQWEDKIISKQAVKINREQARAIIEQVCDDYDIPRVKLKWKKKDDISEYYFEVNTIVLGHRDNLALLHELAHAIIDHHTEASVADHSPSFVWMAIELYHRYGGLDLTYLVATAYQAGLLGDIDMQKVMDDYSIPNKDPKSPAPTP